MKMEIDYLPSPFEKINPRNNPASPKFCQLYLRQRKYNSQNFALVGFFQEFVVSKGRGVINSIPQVPNCTRIINHFYESIKYTSNG